MCHHSVVVWPSGTWSRVNCQASFGHGPTSYIVLQVTAYWSHNRWCCSDEPRSNEGRVIFWDYLIMFIKAIKRLVELGEISSQNPIESQWLLLQWIASHLLTMLPLSVSKAAKPCNTGNQMGSCILWPCKPTHLSIFSQESAALRDLLQVNYTLQGFNLLYLLVE